MKVAVFVSAMMSKDPKGEDRGRNHNSGMHACIHLNIDLHCLITIYSLELVCRRLFDEGLCIKFDYTVLRYVIISKKNGILQHHVHFPLLQKS